MWFCSECGTKNEDSSNFCYECGNAKQQDLGNEPHAVAVEKEQIKVSKSKRKMLRVGIIAIITIALLGTVAFGAKDFLIRKFVLNDPVKRIAYGYKKLIDAKTFNSTTRLSLEFTEYPDDPESKMMVNLINDFSFHVNTKLNNNSNRFLQVIDLRLDDDSLMDANTYGDKETLALSIPSLLDEWIYVEIDELENMLEKMHVIDDSIDFSYEDYEKIFELKDVKNRKEIRNDYIEFISKELGKYVEEEGKKVDVVITDGDKESKIKCEEIVVEMSFRDLIDFIEELLSEIEDDDRIKDLVTQKVQQFFNIAVENGDIDEMNIDEDEIEDIMDEFDDFYDELIEEMLYDVDMIKEEMKYNNTDFELTWSFRFDSANNIRGVNYICEVESSYYDYYEGYKDIDFNLQGELVVNSINKGLNIEKPNLRHGYNFSDEPEEALNDIEEDFDDNFERLLESKEFEPILEFLQTLNPYYFN